VFLTFERQERRASKDISGRHLSAHGPQDQRRSAVKTRERKKLEIKGESFSPARTGLERDYLGGAAKKNATPPRKFPQKSSGEKKELAEEETVKTKSDADSLRKKETMQEGNTTGKA